MMALRYISPMSHDPMHPLDLTFVGQRSVLLYTWKVRTDPWNSDHYPIIIEYNGTIELGKGSKKASRLHNKNTDWTAFTEKVKRKNHGSQNT
jgi:hypothetical protein